MRKVLVLMCALIILIGTPAAAEKVKLGLLPFSGNAKAEYRAQADSALTSLLNRLGRFDIVNPGWNTALPYAFFPDDNEDLVLLGREMQVAIIVAGQVVDLYANRLKDNEGKYLYQAEARVSVRLVSVRSGMVIDTIASSASATDASNSDAAMRSALRKCFDDDMEVRLRELFALHSAATQVAGRTVQFSLGMESGVERGTRFKIYREQYVADEGSKLLRIPVGLVETTSVTETTATGRVLWADDTVLPGDLLLEEARPHKRNFGTGMTLVPYRMQDQSGNTYTGVAAVWRGYSGQERPYSGSWGAAIETPLIIRSVFLVDMSTYFGWETELIAGRWYSTGRLAIGATLATQEFNAPCPWCSKGTAAGASVFVAGSGGLKYYLNRQEGLRLDVGAGFQLGTSITKWVYTDKDKNDHNYTAYVKYPVVNIAGLRLHAGVGVAF